MIDRSSPLPLYYQLADSLKAKITSGVYSPGDQLPTEHELCETFDVSRSVVRQALLLLTQGHLISTERGRGAFVLDRKVPTPLVQQLDPLQDSMSKAGFVLTTKVIRLERIEASMHIADKIGESSAIFIERVRYADGNVYVFVRNYLPYSRMKDLLDFKDLDTVSLYQHLEEHYGIIATSAVRQVELMKLKDKGVAKYLEIKENNYVLFSRELTHDQNANIVGYYESWHHPDRSRLIIGLHRDGASAHAASST